MQSLLQNITRPQLGGGDRDGAGASNPSVTSYLSSVRNKIGTYLAGEVDGDTEDDTIVCRALRKHYSDPARNAPWPAWLPPDPRAPPPPVVAPTYHQNPNVGAGYGVSSQGGQLKDLFGNGVQQQQQPGMYGPRGASMPQQQQHQQPGFRSQSGLDPRGGGGRAGHMQPQQDVQSRPLPSQSQGSFQRGGAYAATGGTDSPTPPGSSGGARSASELLKDRMRNKGKPKMADVAQTVLRNNSYGSQGSASGGGGVGGGGGNYEDRFAPGGTYGGGASRSGGSSGGGGDRPFMAATNPWASDEADFGGGGGGYGARGGQRGPRSTR